MIKMPQRLQKKYFAIKIIKSISICSIFIIYLGCVGIYTESRYQDTFLRTETLRNKPYYSYELNHSFNGEELNKEESYPNVTDGFI